jgi:hypothetical protein
VSRILVYAHPATAAFAVAFVAYVGALGLRARGSRRRSARMLAGHARLAPLLYLLVVAVWATGALSTWALRPDLAIAKSGHFEIGAALLASLSASALSSRWMAVRAVRVLHPWFGAAAILLAAAQVLFGLQLLP